MGFPKELIEKKIWVCWRLEPDRKSGVDKKRPYNPLTCRLASSTNPSTWGTYEQAVNTRDRYGFTGIGFMFENDGPYVGVDVDHCYDPETGQFNEMAQAIMARQATYMEFSPSGTGLHLLFKGKKPGDECRRTEIGIEMYNKERYFTVTGRQVEGSTDIIADDNGTLEWIHSTYLKNPEKEKKTRGSKSRKKTRRTEPLTDEEVLEKARTADDKSLFSDLYDGNWEGRYGSQSEADMALCMKLAFWTGKDAEQMDRLFRQSKLFREKWDERHRSDGTTYGQETISKAIELQGDVYSPSADAVIFEYAGRYFRSNGEKMYSLTNFLVEPVEMVESEDETQLTADLVTDSGTFRRTMLSTDFTSSQKFKNMLNKTGIALGYFGGDADLEQFKVFLANLDWKHKHGVKAAGIHFHGGCLIFVSGSMAIDKKGEIVEDIVQLDNWYEIVTSVLDTDPITTSQLMDIGKVVLSYNEPAKTVPILAWASGCFIKEHLRMKKLKYPLLFLIGEAGSGKSTTMERVLLPIFSVTRVSAASQLTKFVLMRMSNSSNLPPMFLDEFKPSKMNHATLDALYNHFRDTYDGHGGSRGRMNLQMQNFDLLAPMVVAGEESAEEAAIRERSVELLFSKKDLKNGDYRAAFNSVSENSELLENLGRSLLQTALAIDPDTVAKWHQGASTLFDSNLPERVRANLRSAYCGLRLLETLCQSLGTTWNDVFPIPMDTCARYLESSAKDFLLDGGTHNQSVIDETFEIMSRMALDPKNDYAISDDGKLLYIRLAKVYDDYTKYRKDYAITGEVLAYREFRKQLQHSDLFVAANQQKRMGDRNQKVWTLRFDLLSQRCDVSGFIVDGIRPLT